MNSLLILKLGYLLDNFESIDRFKLITERGRNEHKCFVIIYPNLNYFTREELKESLDKYFEDLPIEFSIVKDET